MVHIKLPQDFLKILILIIASNDTGTPAMSSGSGVATQAETEESGVIRNPLFTPQVPPAGAMEEQRRTILHTFLARCRQRPNAKLLGVRYPPNAPSYSWQSYQ